MPAAGPDGQLSERAADEFIDGVASEPEQLHTMNEAILAAMAMAQRSGKRLPPHAPRVDTRIPAFHDEFALAGRLPAQLDQLKAKRLLWNAYETARSQPCHMLCLLRHEGNSTPQVLLKRLHMVSRERVQWWLEASMGDVSFKPRMAYAGGWQSWPNEAARAEALTCGRTHVAIGFVDLTSLAASCLVLDTAQAASSGPLAWVGYEASPFAVAKSLLLLRMLDDGGAELDEVVQVAYSAAWSHASLAAFRAALTRLLQAVAGGSAPRAACEPRVLTLLRSWQARDVSLAEARRGWQQRQRGSNAFIGNFRRKADRLALCAYQLTGQLGRADVGSVLMFAVPPECGEPALDESVLQALPNDLLLLACALGSSAADIMTHAQALLRERLAALAACLRDGSVTAEVRLGLVEPGAACVEEIRALRPWTCSWTNVIDYIEPSAFHRLARSISEAGDTVHYAHSMNWPLEVKGASHLELVHATEERELPKVIPDMLQGLGEAVGIQYRMSGLGRLLLSPPSDNARNLLDFGCMIVHYQAWVQAFFAPALSGIPARRFAAQVQVVQPPTFRLLARTNSTVHLTFTYDPEVHFTVKSNPHN